MCLIDDIIASPREDADHSSVGDEPVESPKLVAVGGGETPKEDLFGEPIAMCKLIIPASVDTETPSSSPETVETNAGAVTETKGEVVSSTATGRAAEQKKKSIVDAFASPPSAKKSSKPRSSHKLK
ncbi:hypothetical protein Pmar_PMAR027296 [Perkinsus marinus ATCC 50983]|nr:hypothetical protein Pmar_PMAR027296 [Perkinsus marinus ATCC 50983]EER15625.1 hypothetical protein Pmar_PMAR027296 [Perkinsus marinus ATCC 50983]|eukprot:XP_002783829.1 hypothetical protein Pmar_PMAR027296 [Perkinsus marinus ATCC 50983]